MDRTENLGAISRIAPDLLSADGLGLGLSPDQLATSPGRSWRQSPSSACASRPSS
jgi:hypothetical protein